MKELKTHFLRIFLALLVLGAASACDSVDDDRIPVMPVQITFNTIAEWNIYGVGGAMDYRRFIRDERIPANYPYTAMTYTGFGGVLLTCDVLGNPMAFDLACPVERKQSVRVQINRDEYVAECPVCHSTYDVFSRPGTPLSGPAANDGYALRRYRVGPSQGGAYMLISN